MHRLLTGVRPYLALLLLCLGLYIPGQAAVPPLDRDESRYMQASKQMLETGDFVAIRFQETPRNKKPVGIYWAQAAAVAAFSDTASPAVWPYRLPSWLGATAAVLMTFGFGKHLFGRAVAFTGAGLLASSLILVAEAHQAKTDAALLACVVAAMGVFGRLYLQARKGPAVPAWQIAAMWLALGVGMLIKGPMPLMVIGLAALALVAADRRWRWLGTARPVTGMILALAVVAPWAFALAASPQADFVSAAVKEDLLPKLLGGQEAHGGFPGLYLAISLATLWPGSLFLIPAAIRSWRMRAEPAVRFCLAWIVPSWIVFELVPTKLPHYPLPLYPAICLLIAAALFAVREPAYALFGRVWQKVAGGLWALIGAALAAAALVLPVLYGAGFAWIAIPTALAAAAAAVLPLRKSWSGLHLPAAALAVLLAVPTYAGVFQGVMPSLDRIWVAPRLADAIRAVAPADAPVALSGYSEPSAVFLIGTATRLTSAEAVAEALAADPSAVGVVDSRDLPAFAARAAALGLPPLEPRTEVAGFNYSKGRTLDLKVFRRDGPSP